MNINDILDSLGLDLTDPEVKRGAIEAIDAIIGSRQSSTDFGSMPGGIGSKTDAEEIELDPDLIQPSVKHQEQTNLDDVEIEDEDNILNQIKHNNSESDLNEPEAEDNNSDDNKPQNSSSSSDSSNNSSEDSENVGGAHFDDAETETEIEKNEVSTDSQPAVPKENDSKIDEIDSDQEKSNEQKSLEKDDDEDTEDDIFNDFDEDDLLDDTLKGTYEDETLKTKHNARKIKRERTLQAAKKALADAKVKKVAPTLIKELESAIAALEELTEAISKNIKDISDEEFNMLINRVFDAIGAVGDSSLTFTTEKEREMRAQEIKADLSNSNTQTELSAEDVAHIRAETQVIKARDKEAASYQARDRKSFKGFQEFLNSLYRAIALQVSTEETNDDTWSAINRRHSGSGVLQPGKRLNELPNKKIPVIDFYFDQSGSWEESDIEIGKKAVAKLADMEAAGQIKINIYYFSNHVHTDAAAARAEGGTRAWNDIVRNIITTQATNVIIMTDADMERCFGTEKTMSYTVPGYVWYLWKNGENAPRLPRDLKGRGGVQQFSFSASDI